jgi:hypothetical protein
MRLTLFAASILAIAALSACSPQQAAAPTSAAPDESALAARDAEDVKPHADQGPGVYFVNLRDGETVTSPFRVVFGLYGMGIAPAGVDKPNTGHHHLLVDMEMTPEEMAGTIPNDEHHIHYGAGLTETVLTLPPGQHTLQLLFGDKDHVPHKPNALESQKITITVK